MCEMMDRRKKKYGTTGGGGCGKKGFLIELIFTYVIRHGLNSL